MKDEKIIVKLTPEEHIKIMALVSLLRHVVIISPECFDHIDELMQDIDSSYLLLLKSKIRG